MSVRISAFTAVLFCFGVFGFAGAAWAESSQSPAPSLDRLCLRDCVQGGGAPARCMTSCRYGGERGAATDIVAAQPASPNANPAAKAMPGRQQRGTGADYRCLNACVQGGYQYDLCKSRCGE